MSEEMSEEEQLAALQQLLRSPGWQLVARWLTATVQVEKQRAMGAEQAHAMAKHLGASVTAEQVLAWPQLNTQVLAQLIETKKSSGT